MSKGWTDTGYFTIISNHVLEDTALTAKARFIYTILVRYGRWKRVAQTNYLVTWVSRSRLAELTCESEWSVSRHIMELAARGLIERTRRPGGSSITYICDPRPIYAQALPDIPDDAPLSADDGDSLEIHDLDPDISSLAPSNVIVGPTQRRQVENPTTGGTQIVQSTGQTPGDSQTAAADKDVAVKDITILSDNSRAQPGRTDRTETGTANGNQRTGFGGEVPREQEPALKGLLARKADTKLTSRSKTKIGAPADSLPADSNDPQTARAIWNEFQRCMITTYPDVVPVDPTGREIGNCRKMLEEYKISDIVQLFDMVVTRWAVVMEKWPRVAKTPTPTFYAAFTLRRELAPLAQSGIGLTSRTHRVDPAAKVPDVGWGDN